MQAMPTTSAAAERMSPDVSGLDVERLTEAIEHEILSSSPVERTGKVLEVIGTLVKVAGLDVTLGELCELRAANGTLLQHAEVIGFTRDVALLSPFSRLANVSRSTRVVGLGRRLSVKGGDAVVGRARVRRRRRVAGG